MTHRNYYSISGSYMPQINFSHHIYGHEVRETGIPNKFMFLLYGGNSPLKITLQRQGISPEFRCMPFLRLLRSKSNPHLIYCHPQISSKLTHSRNKKLEDSKKLTMCKIIWFLIRYTGDHTVVTLLAFLRTYSYCCQDGLK